MSLELDSIDLDDALAPMTGLPTPALTETEKEHYARVKEAVTNAMAHFPLFQQVVDPLVKDRELTIEKSDAYAKIKKAASGVIHSAKAAAKHPAFMLDEETKPFIHAKREAKDLIQNVKAAPVKDLELLDAEENLIARVQEAATRIQDAADEIIDNEEATMEELAVLAPPATETKPAWKENLGYLMLKIGLEVERVKTRQIHAHLDEANQIQKKLGKLIDLNSKMTLYADNEDKKKLGDDVFKLNEELKAEGIDILGGLKAGDLISSERLAEIKGNISNHTDSLKTELQTLFTTKIQVKIQEIQSILECLKTVEKYWNRLISNIIDRYKS